jgi:lipopolysaccharide heptosyltransferase I
MPDLLPLNLPDDPRILIVKPSSIGDIVHALPVLALIRRKYPRANITWLVSASCAALVDHHPLVDRTIIFKRRGNPAWASMQLLHKLRSERFDIAIDLQGLSRSAIFAYATQSPIRVGPADAREWAYLLYTTKVPTGMRSRHAVECNLRIAEAIGMGHDPVEFPLPDEAIDRETIEPTLPREPFAVLIPGTNWKTKRWPPERFAELVRPLRERFGLASVVGGGPSDLAMAARIPADVNLAGKTTLRQTIALLRRADLVIANDSGPMHIAAALGRPLVALFGPTDPNRTGPYRREDSVLRLGIPCSPCLSRRCSHMSCLRWVQARDVLDLAERQLRRHDNAHRIT